MDASCLLINDLKPIRFQVRIQAANPARGCVEIIKLESDRDRFQSLPYRKLNN